MSGRKSVAAHHDANGVGRRDQSVPSSCRSFVQLLQPVVPPGAHAGSAAHAQHDIVITGYRQNATLQSEIQKFEEKGRKQVQESFSQVNSCMQGSYCHMPMIVCSMW